MMKKKSLIVAVFLVCLVFSSHLETVAAQNPAECYDQCNTSCVGKEARLYLRCDRKCKIRCDVEGVKIEEEHLG